MPDLQRARQDVGYFAQVVGCPITGWQAEALKLDALLTVVVAGRQMGKSRALAVLALWWAFTRPGHRVMIVSAGELGARRLLADIRRIATSSPLLTGSVLDEQAGLLTLTTGSEIRSVPASERAIRGWQNDLLLIDEAGSPTADVLLSAALPTITARPHARAVLVDSAWAAEGPFYDFAMQGLAHGGDVRTFRWVAAAAGGDLDAPWVTPSVVSLARSSLGALRFAAEYLGEFGAASDAMFSRALLRRVAAPVAVPEPAALRPPARLLAGCDWGASYDRSAMVALARYPVAALNEDVDVPVFGVAAMKAWRSGEPLAAVVDEMAASRAHWAVVSSERNGIGEKPTQDLFAALRARPSYEGGGRRRTVLYEYVPWKQKMLPRTPEDARELERRASGASWTMKLNAVSTSAELKAQTYGTLRYLADRGQLVLPADTELLRELAALRVELRATGSVGIEAQSGHDDLADALMLAAAPYRQSGDGQWHSVLATAANLAVRDEHPPDLEDARVVKTGDGLRVYRRPVLQSVGGWRLSLVDGATPRRPSEPVVRDVWLRLPDGREFNTTTDSSEYRRLLARGAAEFNPTLEEVA